MKGEDTMTIFVTGDIHGSYDIHKLNNFNLKPKGKIKEGDYLIICGDFGLVWDTEESKDERNWLGWLDSKPWTTLFVDGNHENFDRLNAYPIFKKWNGKVQQISEKVYHLMRGEIYEIEDKKVFAFGGAFSHDREWRKEHESWWQEELPNQEECNCAIKNLENYNNMVDIIVTHDAPRAYAESKGYNRDAMNNGYNENQINILDFLDGLFKTVKYKDWFCGHYHIDQDVDAFHFLYQRILDVDTKENAGCMYPKFQLSDKILFTTKDNQEPYIKGIIAQVYPKSDGRCRSGRADYDILCTEDEPLAKNVVRKYIHEEWIRKDNQE